MSVSQFKNFMKCEAKTLAELKGDWKQETDNTALLVGNYVHSYFESEEAHEAFKEENKDQMYSKRKPHGLLKAYQVAEQMIERVEKEPLFNFLWQGKAEHITTGELFGVKWKGRIDKLNLDKGYFVDIKTTAQLDKRFFNKKYSGYVSFVEEYGYILQMAVYEQLLEKEFNQTFDGIIYAVTKETPSDVAAIKPDQRQLEFELTELERNINHIQKVKNGEVAPSMCGNCDYCREHKKLTGFVITDELIQ